MKISLSWVEEILGTKIPLAPKELAEKLFSLGFEVSSVTPFPVIDHVVTAKILEIDRHPNADKLRLAKVTDGKDMLTVVCGAPNIEVGQVVFWARVGAILPDGLEIKETPIRGIKSPGMLCSGRELGVGENHAGIWVLDAGTPLGASVQSVAGLEDTIFDIEITPNRPDGLSVVGIAREIAAALNIKWTSPHYKFENRSTLSFYPVEIEDKGGCSRYIAKKLTNVTVAPSSPKIQVRLIRSGIRPINNIVDITNYVLLETGQPLHAFDADKLEGGKIIVRRAQEGESVLALDGKTYKLDTDLLVIADASKPVAIAGIMGGQDSAVSETTKNILLESAVFNRSLIRYGRKKLGLASESSYRFERGVSRWSVQAGSDDAESLIQEKAGGKIAAISDVHAAAEEKSPTVTIRNSYVERTLGEKIPVSEIANVFQKLGISVLSSSNESLSVHAPEWRLDLEQEADFAEEIARVRGYDKVPSHGQSAWLPASTGRVSIFYWQNKVRSLFLSLGFDEALNYGLVEKDEALKFFPKESLACLQNPLASDQCVLRPALFLELLGNLKSNLAYQKKEVRLFEGGTAFQIHGGNVIERHHWGVAASGKTAEGSWQDNDPSAVNFYWIKGAVLELLRGLGTQAKFAALNDLSQSAEFLFPDAKKFLHPVYSMGVIHDKELIGLFGLVHPGYAKKNDIAENTVFAELDLSSIERQSRDFSIKKISLLPEIERDCSLWIKQDVSWESVSSEIYASAGPMLKSCRLFDVYTDDAHPGLRSLSFTLTFQPSEKTLSDDEANAFRDAVIKSLSKKFHAELRK